MFKKKKSAIPAFWLDDDAPTDPAVLRAVEQQHVTARSEYVRSRLGMRPPPSQAVSKGTGASGQSSIPMTQPGQPAEAPGERVSRLRQAGAYQSRQVGEYPTSSSAPAKGSESPVTISLNLQLPAFRPPKVTIPKPSRRQVITAAAIGGTAVVVVLVVTVALPMFRPGDKKDVAGSRTQNQGIAFKPLVPSEVEDIRKSPDVRVDDKRQTVTFQDSFANAQIIVTQQTLPDNLKANRDAFNAMLNSVGAKEKDGIETALGKLYLSVRANPYGDPQQFGVLKAESALFMIQASKVLKADVWQDYIATLHVAGT